MPGKPTLEAVPAVKRKNAPKEDEDDSGDDSDSDVSMINVDFDFYNLDADVDQIAVKRLLRQTLSHDDQLIDVHPLAELILSESARTQVGSSIKTDGTESDPWGLVTALDVARNRDHPGFKPLLDYLLSTVPSHNPIQMVLNSTSSPAFNSAPALIFSMRMLNLPLPLIPPLYKMMMDELEAAERRIEKGKGKEGEAVLPRFTHYLLWGRGYRLEGGEEGMGLDMHDTGKKSKKKNKGGAAGAAAASVPMAAGSFAYHPEEEFIDRVASHVHTFPLKSAPPRDDESFGVEQFGRLVLIEREKLRKAVEAMEEACR